MGGYLFLCRSPRGSPYPGLIRGGGGCFSLLGVRRPYSFVRLVLGYPFPNKSLLRILIFCLFKGGLSLDLVSEVSFRRRNWRNYSKDL